MLDGFFGRQGKHVMTVGAAHDNGISWGGRFLAAHQGRQIRLWEIDRRKEIATFTVEEDGDTAQVFCPLLFSRDYGALRRASRSAS